MKLDPAQRCLWTISGSLGYERQWQCSVDRYYSYDLDSRVIRRISINCAVRAVKSGMPIFVIRVFPPYRSFLIDIFRQSGLLEYVTPYEVLADSFTPKFGSRFAVWDTD